MKKQLSLQEFQKKFDNQDKCMKFLVSLKWPIIKEIICPSCGANNTYPSNYGNGYHRKCRNRKCMYRFSPLVGTIFQGTKKDLPLWFYIMYNICISKKNISTLQWSTNMGIGQKAAWYIMTKIRQIYSQARPSNLSGIVEVDECFIANGKIWRKWRSTGTRKLPIIGMIERGGRVAAILVRDRNRATVERVILKHVATGSTIYSDGHLSYKNLNNYYRHDSVNHSVKEYVRGDAHTNSIENFWRFLKASIMSIHNGVSAHHVQSYCDEMAYRFNTRGMDNFDRFIDMMTMALKVTSTKNDLIESKNPKDYSLNDDEVVSLLQKVAI